MKQLAKLGTVLKSVSINCVNLSHLRSLFDCQPQNIERNGIIMLNKVMLPMFKPVNVSADYTKKTRAKYYCIMESLDVTCCH